MDNDVHVYLTTPGPSTVPRPNTERGVVIDEAPNATTCIGPGVPATTVRQ